MYLYKHILYKYFNNLLEYLNYLNIYFDKKSEYLDKQYGTYTILTIVHIIIWLLFLFIPL